MKKHYVFRLSLLITLFAVKTYAMESPELFNGDSPDLIDLEGSGAVPIVLDELGVTNKSYSPSKKHERDAQSWGVEPEAKKSRFDENRPLTIDAITPFFDAVHNKLDNMMNYMQGRLGMMDGRLLKLEKALLFNPASRVSQQTQPAQVQRSNTQAIPQMMLQPQTTQTKVPQPQLQQKAALTPPAIPQKGMGTQMPQMSGRLDKETIIRMLSADFSSDATSKNLKNFVSDIMTIGGKYSDLIVKNKLYGSNTFLWAWGVGRSKIQDKDTISNFLYDCVQIKDSLDLDNLGVMAGIFYGGSQTDYDYIALRKACEIIIESSHTPVDKKPWVYNKLGVIYQYGLGVKPDMERAEAYYRKSSYTACYSFFQGQGRQQDADEALTHIINDKRMSLDHKQSAQNLLRYPWAESYLLDESREQKTVDILPAPNNDGIFALRDDGSVKHFGTYNTVVIAGDDSGPKDGASVWWKAKEKMRVVAWKGKKLTIAYCYKEPLVWNVDVEDPILYASFGAEGKYIYTITPKKLCVYACSKYHEATGSENIQVSFEKSTEFAESLTVTSAFIKNEEVFIASSSDVFKTSLNNPSRGEKVFDSLKKPTIKNNNIYDGEELKGELGVNYSHCTLKQNRGVVLGRFGVGIPLDFSRYVSGSLTHWVSLLGCGLVLTDKELVIKNDIFETIFKVNGGKKAILCKGEKPCFDAAYVLKDDGKIQKYARELREAEASEKDGKQEI